MTHVFALRGSGEFTPKVLSEHGWPILSAIHPVKLEPGKTSYYPVTVRVPSGAGAGQNDVLLFRIGDGVAQALTSVLYHPRLEVAVPAKVEFVPPLSYVRARIKNGGNGSDVFVVSLLDARGAPLFSERLQIAAGEQKEVAAPVERADVYRLVVTSTLGKTKKAALVVVEAASYKPGGPFRLTGHLTAAYAYPRNLSFSVAAAGALSDFVYFNGAAGYALGALPAASASFSWREGYFTVVAGSSYGVAVGLHEGGVAASLSLSGPVPQGGASLDISRANGSYGASLSLSRDPAFRLRARIALRASADDLTSELGSDELGLYLGYSPTQGQLNGSAVYSFVYRAWPLDFRGAFDWREGRPVSFSLAADANPRRLSMGGKISWNGNGLEHWSLAAASSSSRLQLQSPLPLAFGLRLSDTRLKAFANATLKLPSPWSDLNGGVDAEYADGSFSLVASASSQASSNKGMALWGVATKLGWPASVNELSLSASLGGSYLRTQASLLWSPWKPSLGTALNLTWPLGGSLLSASVKREWYSGETRLGVSASMPLVIDLTDGFSDLFGGRRSGVITGRVVVDGPARFKSGIPVRAAGVEALTDDKGNFKLLVPPGEHVVEIAAGKLPAYLVATRAKEKVTVPLHKTVSVSLRVAVRASLQGRVAVEGVKGAPQRNLRFAIALENESGKSTFLYTDSSGAFALPALPPGRYTVRLLADLLPRGWRVLKGAASVELKPGASSAVTLRVAPPPPQIFKGAAVQIMEVKPEADSVPPGSSPLVKVRLRGKTDRVVVVGLGRILGVLLPDAKDPTLWRGRIRVPSDFQGALPLKILAGDGKDGGYPFFLNVNPHAPWGLLRAYPLAKPGQTLPLLAHWYAPVKECWLSVQGRDVALSGSGSDWRGGLAVPSDARGRLRLRVKARLKNGKVIELKGVVLIRER